MLFKEGIRTYISCVSEKEAEMRITPQGGKNVTSLMTRCTGKWGVNYYEVVAWEKEAILLDKAVKSGGVRIMVVIRGVVRKDPFWEGKDRVQYKVNNPDEVWVENLETKQFDEVISKHGVDEEDERVFEPIAVPEAIG